MSWNPFKSSIEENIEQSEKELSDSNLARGQQTALNNGTPVTVIHSTGNGKVVVANDLTDLCEEVDRSEIAEPEKKKSGWFW